MTAPGQRHHRLQVEPTVRGQFQESRMEAGRHQPMPVRRRFEACSFAAIQRSQ